MLRCTAAIIAISATAGGCAIHPIPDNVTGLSTVAIVSQIRCEAQRALQDLLVGKLEDEGDPASIQKSLSIAKDIRNVVLLKDYSKLSPNLRKIFDKYDGTVIVFDFQLRMTETNNIGAGTNFVSPFKNGFDLFGLKVADNKERQNFRTFRITTNLVELFSDRCEAVPPTVPNFQYPIAGNVGLKEIFFTYFELANNNKLGDLKDWNNSPFVDTLKFTTDISGEFSPSLVTTPTGKELVTRDAAGLISSGRKDEHQLIVGISLPVPVSSVIADNDASASQTSRGGPRVAVRSRNAEARSARSSITKTLVNQAVNSQIVKFQTFGLNPLDPFGPLNR